MSMEDSNVVVIENFDLDDDDDDVVVDEGHGGGSASKTPTAARSAVSVSSSSFVNMATSFDEDSNMFTPLVEWKEHRNRISDRLGLDLKRSPVEQEDADDSDPQAGESIFAELAGSMGGLPLDLSSSGESSKPGDRQRTAQNHFQLLARNRELENALDTSHEHIELLADQLSSSSHKNDTSNHIILKWKESYRQLEEKMHAKAKLLSKVEHDYSTLQHAMEFQRKEASLEKATLTAKFELATKRLDEALSAKNNTMQLANQLEMTKAELVLVKNENLTLGQHLKEKDIAINRLSNDLMASQHTAQMNKSEIVIVRQELKDFGERYAEKESEAVRLASEVLSAGERLKRAMDEKAEVERKLIDQQQVFDTEMQNMKHRVLALETSKTQSEQASLRLKAEMDALQDRKKSLGMQLDASNARVTELKRMYDDLHYDAERERKLAQKLEKAKRTIKMQRHYTRERRLSFTPRPRAW